MQFSIVFENSGDSIPFISLNPNVLEYYVDQLAKNGSNSFRTTNPNYAKKINATIHELHAELEDTNSWLSQLFDQTITTFSHNDYLDQSNLNYLHSVWVNIQNCKLDLDSKRQQANFQGLPEQLHDIYPDDNRFPILGDVVGKIGKKEKFDRLNTPLIHGLETSFSNILFECINGWVEFNNPFPKNIITNDTCNLFLPFNHLGRTQYDKFVNFDHELEYNDENTFNELLGFVSLGLTTPQTRGFSKEYINWCKLHNVEPSGEKLPLGNIPDLLTNLTKYRIIVLRNTTAENNFRIELHKG